MEVKRETAYAFVRTVMTLFSDGGTPKRINYGQARVVSLWLEKHCGFIITIAGVYDIWNDIVEKEFLK